MFGRVRFQANSSGARVVFVLTDIQTTWTCKAGSAINLGEQVQRTQHYHDSLAGGFRLAVV
jgi:hypothetical protein